MKINVHSQIVLDTNEISNETLDRIAKRCTVKNKEYFDELAINGWVRSDIPQSYQLYEVDNGYMYLPRGFLDELIRILRDVEIEWNTTLFEETGFRFREEMEEREYQNKAVEELLKYRNGILVAPTGSGKTNIMIKLIEKLQQPTLILVHRYFLINQWKERLKTFLGYTPGIIAGNKWKVKNITLAMIPTLYADPRRIERLKDRFGLVVIDECHHTPAYTWISNILQLTSNYMFGCSATPTRKDQLQKLMFLTVGPIRHIVSNDEATKLGAVIDPIVKIKKTKFVGWPAFNRVEFTKLMPKLTLDKPRNKIIANTIISEPDNYHLVLSDRIHHLEILKDMIDEAGISSAIVTGSVSDNDRKEIFKKVSEGDVHVLFATSLADEGLDIPILDRVHLTFPTSNPDRNMQQIGRIRRPLEGKKNAVVYDYHDWMNTTLSRQFQNRKRKYRQNKWNIEFI